MLLTRDMLSRYLTEKLGRNLTVTDLSRFPRGSSRQTWFLRYSDSSGPSVELVLRADLPAGSTEPTALEQEYFIYERLGRSALPVARVLWWEGDLSWAGQPFYVREKVAGSWNIPHFSDPDPQYDELRVKIAQEHLRKLAMVHQLDWRGLGFGERLPVPDDEADAAHCYVRSLLKLYEDLAIEPMPLVIEACEWLHDHAPVAPRLSLCKGTNGHGEEVFRDGEIVALSDWEEVSIGDPAADFAFMQGFLFEQEVDGVPVWNTEKALQFYNSVSGIGITLESLRYYQVMRALRMLIMMQNAGIAVSRRGEPDIRQAWSGTEVLHLSKHILASAMGMLPPVSAQRFAQLNETVDME